MIGGLNCGSSVEPRVWGLMSRPLRWKRGNVNHFRVGITGICKRSGLTIKENRKYAKSKGHRMQGIGAPRGDPRLHSAQTLFCPFLFPPSLFLSTLAIWATCTDLTALTPVYRSILDRLNMFLFGRWPALLLLPLTVWAADKNLIPTSASDSFPTCGLQCSQLYAAQDSCTANPDSSTWVSCFCQSAFVSNLKTSGAVCTNCDSNDQSKVSSWYTNYCNSGGTDKGTTSTSTTSSSTSTATAGSSTSNSSTSTTDENKSWWVSSRSSISILC